MSPNEYQKLAELTENKDFFGILKRLGDERTLRLIHAAQGLTTETGEFTDTLKKYVFYGSPIDEVNMAEEVGDLMWYIAEACNALGIDLEDVMERNIEKLQTRYPQKFEASAALNRNLEQERKILEGGSNGSGS